MTDIEIGGKKYSVPDSWDEITLGTYCKLFHNLPEVKEDAPEAERVAQRMETEAVILSRLLGEDDGFVGNLPVEVFIYLEEHTRFLYSIDDFTDSRVFYLNIGGRKYFIPEPREMSLRQYIDADYIMKDGKEDEFVELLACLLLPYGKDGKYEYDGNYRDLMPRIAAMSASDALPFIYTFFKKKQLSRKATEAFSGVTEAADLLLHSTQGS